MKALKSLLLGLLGVLGTWARAETPHWITWTNGPVPAGTAETLHFRRTFRTPPYNWNARLTVAADAAAEVLLNGRPVARSEQPDQPVRAEVSVNLNQGDNVLAVRVSRTGGPPALLLHLNLGGTETREIVSDDTWRVSREGPEGWTSLGFDDREWRLARSLGPHGIAPWGEVLYRATATPAESLHVAPGFHAELLRSAGPEEGSWVCLAVDPGGRLVISPEGEGRPLLRVTLDGDGRVGRVDAVPAPIRFAMGLLFAHGSLYANARGPQGTGLYRLTDANGNDQFDVGEERLLKAFQGGGEHGYHALALGPDGWIHVLNGNVTKLPENLSPRSPHRTYGEDILSLNPDETTRAGGALAPGGYIARTDPEGAVWELVAAGLRNAYDFDFNEDGELFTYDSDNEWDWGTPWYRPTRVFHAVSGAEFGWRDGTRAWPDGYPDQVWPVADLGIGSPCGVRFGTRARFPERYRRALFVQDWSYGRILAVFLEAHGATYRGRYEEFLRGQPLNLTSMAFGPDGAMYFVTGGRGTQSGLYRVTYRGTEPVAPGPGGPLPGDAAAAGARRQRRQLEALQAGDTEGAVDAVWPFLGHHDPALRYAARIALEAQAVARWQERTLAEAETMTALPALLALARVGPASIQPALLGALARHPWSRLDEAQVLLKLRVLQLSFVRQGRPSADWVERAIGRLSPRYPAPTWPENRELSRLLIWMEAPGVVERTLDLLEGANSQAQQVHYVAQLRNLRPGWTPETRRRYLAWWTQPRDHLARPGDLLHWFHEVGRSYVDGANLNRHLEAFRRDALRHLDDTERAALRDLIEAPIAGAQLVPPEPRSFVREWTMADLVPELERAGYGRDYERGRRAYIDVQCAACHRFGNVGGAVGPEITALASKYSRREILESLLEPSKVISEQYQNVRVFLKDGEDVTGRVVRDVAEEIVLETDPLTRTEQAVPRSAIDKVRPSTVSPMPEGLLHVLTRDEILDLLAYLESGGNPDAPVFRQP